MFSLEYFNKSVIISVYGTDKLNVSVVEKLRKLVIQSMKQPCKKIILDIKGVKTIDKPSIEILKLINGIAHNLGIELIFINPDNTLSESFKLLTKANEYTINTRLS